MQYHEPKLCAQTLCCSCMGGSAGVPLRSRFVNEPTQHQLFLDCNHAGLAHNGKRVERQNGKEWKNVESRPDWKSGKSGQNMPIFKIFIFLLPFLPISDRGQLPLFSHFSPCLAFGPFSIVDQARLIAILSLIISKEEGLSRSAFSLFFRLGL